jgi:hypothetical protein
VFSAEWLTLREPADFAARAVRLTRELIGSLDSRDEVRALDLAAGTGANARYLADQMTGCDQDWILADHDPQLLSHVVPRMSAWAVARGAELEAGTIRLPHGRGRISFATRSLDLRGLEDQAIFAGRTLVTASALLDLVSEPWLRSLAARCRQSGASALLALTYDGRMQCEPVEPEDRMIREFVNQHQRRDKGFGPALGPDAVEVAERSFAEMGFAVRRERSDWILGPRTAELQRQLIEGWARAAAEIAPGQRASVDEWRRRRLAHVDRNRSRITVGHQDLSAIRR